MSGADFTGADLRGAHMTSLVTSAPPNLAGVRIGALAGACTLFKNSDLVGTGIAPVQADALVTGCESTAMFPDSEIPISVVALLSVTYKASVDYSDATILVTAGNSGALAGADLSGIHLAGASFVGFPANLQKTHFDGASLMGTSMQLADLTNATFLGATATAASFQDAVLQSAKFTGSKTNLTNADFAGADVSSASFQNATLTGAVFDHALANGTSFDSVIATNTRFVGAHVYGMGDAFDGARELTGADFTDAVLGGDDDGTADLDFTNADLTGAKFDNAQCVGCNFSNAILTGVTATDAYLPGAQLSTATLQSASFDGTWLYCGSLPETACKSSSTSPLEWPLKLGSQEDYGPVVYSTTTLTQGALVRRHALPGRDAAGAGRARAGLRRRPHAGEPALQPHHDRLLGGGARRLPHRDVDARPDERPAGGRARHAAHLAQRRDAGGLLRRRGGLRRAAGRPVLRRRAVARGGDPGRQVLSVHRRLR